MPTESDLAPTDTTQLSAGLLLSTLPNKHNYKFITINIYIYIYIYLYIYLYMYMNEQTREEFNSTKTKNIVAVM
jgi:hypothetical protein